MEQERKHAGCANCKSKDQEILISVPNFKNLSSRALCNGCLEKEGKK